MQNSFPPQKLRQTFSSCHYTHIHIYFFIQVSNFKIENITCLISLIHFTKFNWHQWGRQQCMHCMQHIYGNICTLCSLSYIQFPHSVTFYIVIGNIYIFYIKYANRSAYRVLRWSSCSSSECPHGGGNVATAVTKTNGLTDHLHIHQIIPTYVIVSANYSSHNPNAAYTVCYMPK